MEMRPVVEPATSAPEPTLATLLQAVPAFIAGADLAEFVTCLVTDAKTLDKNGRDALVNANVRRVRIGQAWAVSMPAKRTEREAWMTAQGVAHGLGLTRVRQIVRAATALGKAIADVSADRLPITVLDRKLEAIPTALKAVLEGRGPDQPQPRKAKAIPSNAQERRLVFAAKVDAALKAVFAGHEMEIPAALKAISKPAPTAVPKPTPGPIVKAEPEETRLGPVLHYAGGKTFVAPLLAQVLGKLPPDAEIREPYCGGASVSIHMLLTGRASKVWLNDLDPVVQAVWNSVIHEPDALCTALDGIVHGSAEFKKLRAAVNKRTLAGPELAAAAIYVQKFAYKGTRQGEFRTDPLKWVAAVAATRVREAHGLLAGRVVHGECTGRDALEVIRAPGNAVLFLDPPYWRVGTWMYRKAYKLEAEFQALADALHYHPDRPNHPWIMTIGDDEVSDRMHIPGSAIHRIRSGVRWLKTKGRMSETPDGEPGWLLDLDREDVPRRELLITSAERVNDSETVLLRI